MAVKVGDRVEFRTPLGGAVGAGEVTNISNSMNLTVSNTNGDYLVPLAWVTRRIIGGLPEERKESSMSVIERDELDDPKNWPNGMPDAWMIQHNRATDACHFGPFPTHGELEKWRREIGDPQGVRGVAIPLWISVDWNR